jgi:predicted membrane-bound dolichyl-phosphate-mannose-protein mannosyltransferase
VSAAATAITAKLAPELFVDRSTRSLSRTLIVATLTLIILVGFGFRVVNLGAEGLSEDELNKLNAVEDYRAHGLTSINGEHPMLMKALLTLSVVAAERWNATSLVASNPSLRISTEAALRFPGVVFGALTSLLIFLIVSELFGIEIALIAAALWAIDPSGIGFGRIAKEDTFFIFFFLLANFFWLKSQRIAESMRGRPEPYIWATAVAFGMMMASKYLPHFIGISVSYYHIFQAIPATRWRMGKKKFLIFFAIMGGTFLICNPAILLPGTWHEMRLFAGEHRIGHDSYEFMGQLYPNQLTLWLKGSPWYFYFVFMGVKMSLPVVASFLVGLAFLFRKRLGDGRFFILFWMLFWFMPFSVLGGKFTRYFTLVLPVVLMTAAIGIYYVARFLAHRVSNLAQDDSFRTLVRATVVAVVLAFPIIASASVSPYYRLYTNALGGGMKQAGSYFPHDEFYDARTREAAEEVARRARAGARVASETPGLVTYYAQLAGRNDLVSVSLSDDEAMKQFEAGDFVIVARGRRYFSNEDYIAHLEATSQPIVSLSLGETPAVRIFMLDENSRAAVSETLK